MYHQLHSLLIFTSIVLHAAFAAPEGKPRECKEVPSSPGWPSPTAWSKLNSTLGGRLLAALPPAVVCDKSREQYSAEQCANVNENWWNATFHVNDPVSVQWPNWQEDACLPSAAYNGSNACQIDVFAKYTVNASEAQHVVLALKFAKAYNLRVSVKNTGHDWLGRSTSPEFSVWTHNLKGLQTDQTFKPQGCVSCSPVPAIIAGAGNQFADIYAYATDRDFLVVGGSEPSVGLGGWLTGGGHSPVGAMYGLGVDNVLEMEIVTPAGNLITANECQNSDIFWAMRGGGGSTFGIMISAAMKIHPNYPASNFTMIYSSTKEEAEANANANFYAVLADMFEGLVSWSDNYVNGYFTFGPTSAQQTGTTTTSKRSEGSGEPMSVSFTGYGHNMTGQQLKDLMAPFTSILNATQGVHGSILISEVPHISDVLGTDAGYSPAGVNIIIGSRLWAKEALLDKARLLDFYRKVESSYSSGAEAGVFTGPISGLLISGPGLRDAPDADQTSVSPSWRRTYLHLNAGALWDYKNETQTKTARQLNTNVFAKNLRDMAPDMGCYLNEADVYEPDWKQAFWGDNYDRSLQIKHKYDPDGTFWCLPCVGHDEWEMDEGTRRLCRAH